MAAEYPEGKGNIGVALDCMLHTGQEFSAFSGMNKFWPKTTFLLLDVRQNGRQIYTKLYKNKTGDRHAEEFLASNTERRRVLNCIKKSKQDIERVTVTLMLNFSPCSDCSGYLIALSSYLKDRLRIESGTDLDCVVEFTQLYKMQAKYDTHRGQHGGVAQQNKDGLYNLSEAGIEVGTISWVKLYRAVKQSYIDREVLEHVLGTPQKRLTENKAMRYLYRLSVHLKYGDEDHFVTQQNQHTQEQDMTLQEII